MSQIDFHIWRTNDVWVRDNGPIFAYDASGRLVVQDWEFNGWGGKTEYHFDNVIPQRVGAALNLPIVHVAMVNEGGSVELDGHGTLMAKKSSILNPNRNPGWTLNDLEEYFRKYLDVSNFIWLEGEAGYDITDDHIDGTARFANDGRAIVTFYKEDFLDPSEYTVLENARNANGERYQMVHLPLTQSVIPKIRDFGTYVNYYVGNDVVIVPIYGDPNDQVAMGILGNLFPTREMVGIDFTELYRDGGLVHCVTQQQPLP